MSQVIIRLRGEYIETQAEKAADIMKMISRKAQIQIENEEAAVVGNKKQWKKLVDARFGWRGDILLKCNDAEEAIKLYQGVEGKALEIGDGGRITIEIIPHAKVIIEARNATSF